MSLEDIKKNKVSKGNLLAGLATVLPGILLFVSFELTGWAGTVSKQTSRNNRELSFLLYARAFGLALALQASDCNPVSFLF